MLSPWDRLDAAGLMHEGDLSLVHHGLAEWRLLWLLDILRWVKEQLGGRNLEEVIRWGHPSIVLLDKASKHIRLVSLCLVAILELLDRASDGAHGMVASDHDVSLPDFLPEVLQGIGCLNLLLLFLFDTFCFQV